MNTMIYNPLEEYEKKFKALHLENTQKFFDGLVKRSGVNVEENRKTVKQYHEYTENLKKLKRKLNFWRFLRVVMIIALILIPLVIWKVTPKIRALREEVAQADQKARELLAQAYTQMEPLNTLFTARDALDIIESTVPLLSFAPCFSVEQENNMIVNFDFGNQNNIEHSTLDVLAGHYNENPFLFENKMIHRMGSETYHGYKTIHWTESYRDSNGRRRRKTCSQTLHATVTKPKPFYHTQVQLNYCAQGAPELSFTRDATHLDQKTEKEIRKHIKKGEKKLKKMTDKALAQNRDFMSMSNSDFEVLFDATDRNNEVQFRTLFTPLAQTNMVNLILSQSGFGDDFHFIKHNRTNKIITKHSQGRPLSLSPTLFLSFDFDIIKESFIGKNTAFFKAVYFDLAPILAIPVYQERPVHSLNPIPHYDQKYSYRDCEALANAMDPREIAHPDTKTTAILKSDFVRATDAADEIRVTAYSYDIVQRLDLIPMLGGDGRFHDVPVPWDDYIPLEKQSTLFVGEASASQDKRVITTRNNLCIYYQKD